MTHRPNDYILFPGATEKDRAFAEATHRLRQAYDACATVDELREFQGLPPLGGDEGSAPVNPALKEMKIRNGT